MLREVSITAEMFLNGLPISFVTVAGELEPAHYTPSTASLEKRPSTLPI